jgi:hypothetical protein
MSGLIHDLPPFFAVAAVLAAPAYLLVAGIDLRDALRLWRERRPCLCHFLKAAAYVLLGLAAIAH